MERYQRQKRMPYSCKCIACTHDFPLLQDLPKGSIELPIRITAGILKQFKFDRKQSMANYQYVVDYLQTNNDHIPSVHSITLSNYYINIMNVIYCKEICIEMRVNPVEQSTDILHGLRKSLSTK